MRKAFYITGIVSLGLALGALILFLVSEFATRQACGIGVTSCVSKPLDVYGSGWFLFMFLLPLISVLVARSKEKKAALSRGYMIAFLIINAILGVMALGYLLLIGLHFSIQ